MVYDLELKRDRIGDRERNERERERVCGKIDLGGGVGKRRASILNPGGIRPDHLKCQRVLWFVGWN